MRFVLASCLAALLVAGCGKSRDPSWVTTVPVTGKITVDGKSVDSVRVTFHTVGENANGLPATFATFTAEDGSFKASTYEEGDGLPVGKYQVTFFWGELDVFSMQYGGEDKLAGRYSDPAASEYVIDVADGSPVEMGDIRLTTE